jgi:hypothetical protein
VHSIEQPLERGNDQAVHRLGALAPRLNEQRLQELGIALECFVAEGFHGASFTEG